MNNTNNGTEDGKTPVKSQWPGGFDDAPCWTGSFYTDNSLDLIRERYNELLQERQRQFAGDKAETEPPSTDQCEAA